MVKGACSLLSVERGITFYLILKVAEASDATGGGDSGLEASVTGVDLLNNKHKDA